MSAKEQKLVARIYQQLQLPEAASAIWERVFAQSEPSRHELETLVSLYRQSWQVDKALKTLDRSLHLLRTLKPWLEAESSG